MNKQTINMAIGSAMESILANPVVKEHVGGKLGKLVKGGLMAGAFLAAAMSGTAYAQSNPLNFGCVVGAVAGGLLGHTAGGGNGKTALTAAGAVGGCFAGQAVQGNSQYRQPGAPVVYPGIQGNAYPGIQGNAYPVVGPHPMSNYMHNVFAQISGQQQPTQELTQQGALAMEKAISEAETRMRLNVEAQRQYAVAYQQYSATTSNGMNPEAQALIGSQALKNSTYQSQGQLNQASQIRNQANINFGSAGMRVADLSEFEASQGYDIRAYGSRIIAILSAPMSSPVLGVSPVTRQNVTFSTGSVEQAPRVPGY